MSNEYIISGKANRGAIASGVRFRKLNRAGIETLCAKPEVQSVFIGNSFARKVTDKSEWDESYLDSLHGAYNECFNHDYLLHLDEVADFVSKDFESKKTTRKKFIIAGVIVVLVIIAGVIVFNLNTHQPQYSIEGQTTGGQNER
jgi:hypothetical protein